MAFCLNRFPHCNELFKYGSKYFRLLVLSENRCLATSSNSPEQQCLQSANKIDVEPQPDEEVEVNDHTQVSWSSSTEESISPNEMPSNIRFQYPEFLPNPHIPWRNPIKEKLERKDMLARRSQIHIPEFYVGTIMKVTQSNAHQPDKTSKFLGICIERDGTGLRATFTLRNVIDNLGVEMTFELYDPKLQKIEVLRLERRLDDNLGYLKDAYAEYSTFPLNMRAEVRRTGNVPVNPIKVKLKPRPWITAWHKHDFKGIENIESLLSKKMILKHKKYVKPWEKYDLMTQYRRNIPEEDQCDIYSEVFEELADQETNKSASEK